MARYGFTATVDTGQMPSSQSNFVWLATEDNFPTAAIDGGGTSILNGGGNLRCYTDSTKATQLPIEVVTFVTGGTPSVQVWGLSSTLNVASTVYFEADTVATTQPAVTDTYGRNAVWVDRVSNYHLEDDVDSAGNNDLNVSTGTPAFSAGEIGNSLDLNGSSDIFGFFSGSTGTDITITTWVNPDDTTSPEYIIYGDGNTSPMNINAIIKGFQNGYFNIFDNGYPTGNANDTRIAATAATWQKITYTSDGTTLKGFKNGIEVFSVSASLSITYGRLFIGSSAGANFFNGLVDEAYISNEYRGVDYDLSEYNNQSSPSTFWTAGAWEDQDAGGGLTVTPSTINSLSVSNNPSISFASILNVLPTTINSLSVSTNPLIEFKSVVIVQPQAINSLSITQDPTIQFSSVLSIAPQTINSASISLDPTIDFTSLLNISPQTINSLSISENPLIEFKSKIDLFPQAVNSLSIARNPIISTGQEQTIGEVTASFKDSGISVKYDNDIITVNFK